jgi:hypothetical protein
LQDGTNTLNDAFIKLKQLTEHFEELPAGVVFTGMNELIGAKNIIGSYLDIIKNYFEVYNIEYGSVDKD